jgi:phage terminase small subunit
VPVVVPGEEEADAIFPHDIFDECTVREQRAILYYLQSGDKAASIRAAGYKTDSATLHSNGSSHGVANVPSTENKHGSRFFARPKIAEAVERAQALLTARAGIATEDILAALKSDAYGDLGDIYKPGTFELKPVSEWPEELRRSAQEVTIRTMPNGDVIATVKWPDRIRAKELLGKHKRLWDDKAHQGGNQTLVIMQNMEAPASITIAAPIDTIDAGSFRIERPASALLTAPPREGTL